MTPIVYFITQFCLLLAVSIRQGYALSGLRQSVARLTPKPTVANVVLPTQREEIRDPAAQEMMQLLRSTPLNVPEFVSSKPVACSYAKYDAIPAKASQATSRPRSASLSLFDYFSPAQAQMEALLKPKASSLPVVMLHGFDSSCLEFRRLAPLLSEGGVDVYVPDILGWGFAGAQAESYGPEAKLEHLRCFIKQVVGGPCVLVGASLGGGIAVLLAADSPELVEKVVLIDAQGFIDGKGKSDLPLPLAKFGVNVLKSWPLRMFANYLSYTDKSFASLDAMRIGRLHCLVETWEDASVDFLLSGGFVVSNKVAAVEQPTLVIWGRDDRILEPSTAELFQASLPRSQLYWVEACGHVPHLEKPREAADAVLGFLSKR